MLPSSQEDWETDGEKGQLNNNNSAIKQEKETASSVLTLTSTLLAGRIHRSALLQDFLVAEFRESSSLYIVAHV